MVLLICVLWVGSGFHTAQSVPLAEGGTIWVTFLHVVWYDKAAGPARARQRRERRRTRSLCTYERRPPQPGKKKEGFLGFQSYNRLFVSTAVTSHYL